MGRELEKTPEPLGRPNVSTLNITGNLVVRKSSREGRTVRALVYVLMNILDGMDCSTYLDINMASVLL